VEAVRALLGPVIAGEGNQRAGEQRENSYGEDCCAGPDQVVRGA
jgi:hypothetical protein